LRTQYALAARATDVEPPTILGVAELAAFVFVGRDLDPLWAELMAKATATPPDPGAMLDLSTILQLVGRRDDGLALQADALGLTRFYRRVHGDGTGPRILALMTGGDLMANTPIDFLLKGSNAVLDLLFVDFAALIPANLPPHDVVFLAIGESPRSGRLLTALDDVLAHSPRPVINGRGDRIQGLVRDRAATLLAGAPGVVAPATVCAGRAELDRIASGRGALGDLLAGEAFPIIARPIGSHAGAGLERLEGPAALAAYLAACDDDAFFISPFIDYSSDFGLFRKYRIALVDGRPFICHMAVSEGWMVHYLNAGMAEDARKRAEEAKAMADFDSGFARRHAGGLAEIVRRVGLDYFAIDCAETRDGRLLVFEADTAMIVHDMDPPDLYPYKPAAMAKLFAAFQDLVARRAYQPSSYSMQGI
jgi:hypothetical protein